MAGVGRSEQRWRKGGQHNPMHHQETVEKVRRANHGRTFLARGGNGTITKQQEKLRQALGLPESALEFAIFTNNAKGSFPSLPIAYKVDLGIPEVKLAIEVDGASHKKKKWKFLDQRKTAVLNHLGWTVLRFWNAEIDQDLNRCVQTVMSTISRLRETTTTSPTECSFTTATSSKASQVIEDWPSTSL
jgi:very-short-patch-repair endonuclease